MRKISRAFHPVFFTVVGFTLLSGGGSFWLAGKETLSPEQTRIFETCNTTWNMGIGAIFGLLGVRAINPLNSQEEEE